MDLERRWSETCKLYSMFKSQHMGHSYFRMTNNDFHILIVIKKEVLSCICRSS